MPPPLPSTRPTLPANGSVIGSSGNDTLASGRYGLDLSSTALTSIEILKAGDNMPPDLHG